MGFLTNCCTLSFVLCTRHLVFTLTYLLTPALPAFTEHPLSSCPISDTARDTVVNKAKKVPGFFSSCWHLRERERTRINLKHDGHWEGNRTGARDRRRLLSLVSHHHLSPEPPNSLLSAFLASSLVPINPHLVVSIPHLKLVNGSP